MSQQQVAPPSTPYGAPILLEAAKKAMAAAEAEATKNNGGVPIVSRGRIVGGIGVSGVASHQDAQVAQAGADALK